MTDVSGRVVHLSDDSLTTFRSYVIVGAYSGCSYVLILFSI